MGAPRKTTHHCPRANTGGCKWSKTPRGQGYCQTHCTYCKDPDCDNPLPFIKGTQTCKQCDARRARAERLAAELAAKAAAEAKKAADAAEASKKRKKAGKK